MSSQVKTETKSHVLHVTLTRPEAHNALSPEIMTDLTKIFTGIKKDKSVKAVVLRGEGPSFCAGGDLGWMRASIKYNLAQNLKDTKRLSVMYESIFHCPVPVLARVQGNVMGGGLGLTAVCDIVAAETETKFCFSELKIGMVPSIITPYILRKIPETNARGLMLTAEIFKAPEAHRIGLVHATGTVEENEKFLEEKLAYITGNAPEATRITKDIIQKIKTSNYTAARDFSVKTIAQRRISKEGQEGLNAFFEKRPPSWRQDK